LSSCGFSFVAQAPLEDGFPFDFLSLFQDLFGARIRDKVPASPKKP